MPLRGRGPRKPTGEGMSRKPMVRKPRRELRRRQMFRCTQCQLIHELTVSCKQCGKCPKCCACKSPAQ